VWSSGLSRYTAASTPTGTPMPTPIMMAKVASSIVAGNTRLRSSATRLPVNRALPKSPVSMSRMKNTNCCQSGLSRPSWR